MNDLLIALDEAQTDKELFDSASAIIAIPKAPGTTFDERSFLLHAPLELCARYYLLSLVDDEHANAARARIRLMAKKYHEFPDAASAGHPESTSSHPERSEGSLPIINIETWSSSTLFASHGPILYALQYLLGETNTSIAQILHRMNNAIMSDPEAQFSWVNDPPVVAELGPDHIEHPTTWMLNNVGNIQRTEPTETITGQIHIAQKAGLLDPIASHISSIATFSQRADFTEPFKALLRIAVLSMIVEDETYSKYGWTHCATIPHSLYVLLSDATHPAHLLKSAASYVATFRSTMGQQEIHSTDMDDYFEPDEESVFAEHYVRMEEIISHACAREDAHLIKYTYTCFDMMKRDPHYSKLYIAAAGKLLNVWKSEESLYEQ